MRVLVDLAHSTPYKYANCKAKYVDYNSISMAFLVHDNFVCKQCVDECFGKCICGCIIHQLRIHTYICMHIDHI